MVELFCKIDPRTSSRPQAPAARDFRDFVPGSRRGGGGEKSTMKSRKSRGLFCWSPGVYCAFFLNPGPYLRDSRGYQIARLPDERVQPRGRTVGTGSILPMFFFWQIQGSNFRPWTRGFRVRGIRCRVEGLELCEYKLFSGWGVRGQPFTV